MGMPRVTPKPPPDKPSGRAIVDKDGKNSWAWQDDVDTARIKTLGDELSLSDGSDKKAPDSLNPYDRNPAPQRDTAGKHPTGAESQETKDSAKRTLDDMRQLSEKIKRSKRWTRDS
jgi:hypothetical protein